jgi:hypothetical protein
MKNLPNTRQIQSGFDHETANSELAVTNVCECRIGKWTSEELATTAFKFFRPNVSIA